MAGKARNRLIKAQRKEAAKVRICPVMTTAWCAPLPGGPTNIIKVGGQQHGEQPMINGVAEVPCPENEKCAWWNAENGECAVNGIVALLELVALDDDGEDPGDTGGEPEPETPGGDDGKELEEVSHDQGTGASGA